MRFAPRIAFGRWYKDPELDRMRVRAALELLTQVNVAILQRYGSAIPSLYQAGLRYGYATTSADEDDDWCDILAVIEQGAGDCEELAAYRVAELRARHGVNASCDIAVTWNATKGRNEYHVFVRYPDGRTEDPSDALGMRRVVRG